MAELWAYLYLCYFANSHNPPHDSLDIPKFFLILGAPRMLLSSLCLASFPHAKDYVRGRAVCQMHSPLQQLGQILLRIIP